MSKQRREMHRLKVAWEQGIKQAYRYADKEWHDGNRWPEYYFDTAKYHGTRDRGRRRKTNAR